MPLKPEDIKPVERLVDCRFKTINISPHVLWEYLGLPTVAVHSFNLEVLGEMLLYPDDVVVVANLFNEPGYITLLLYGERFKNLDATEVTAQYRSNKNGKVEFNGFLEAKD